MDEFGGTAMDMRGDGLPGDGHMALGTDGLDFYETLAPSQDFRALGDPANYSPVPSDWVVGVADIVRSSDAIIEGRYKTVNTIAAAVIAAIANALPGRDFPYAFGGDGAGFVLPRAKAALGEQALKGVARWAFDQFGLELRTALVPVSAIREAGRDVTVARYAPSPNLSYAMFGGGGLTYAEQRMKAGDYRLEPASATDEPPDFTGLYCRFAEIPAKNDVILSLVVLLGPKGDRHKFYELARDILAIAGEEETGANPVPANGPKQIWPSPGLPLEARLRMATHRIGFARAWASSLVRSLVAHATFASGRKFGGVDTQRYVSEIAEHTDFRKFGDGLRMTLDCTYSLAERIEARLLTARDQGIARFGTHTQDAALMTCFVPTTNVNEHVHFVDGAQGGYAAAAAMAEAQGDRFD